MYQALYPRDDIDRLYVLRKKGGRGLVIMKDSVDVSVKGLEQYIKKSKKDQLQQRLSTVAT